MLSGNVGDGGVVWGACWASMVRLSNSGVALVVAVVLVRAEKGLVGRYLAYVWQIHGAWKC